MTHFHWHSKAIVLTVIGLACCAGGTQAGEPISLRLGSGRLIVGETSPRTNAAKLWLVQRAGSAQLSRPIAWEKIIAVEFRSQSLTGRQLRDLLVETKVAGVGLASLQHGEDATTSAPNTAEDPFRDDPPHVEELPLQTPESAGSPNNGEAIIVIEPLVPPVESVRIDAHLANWDADVEVDGLVVQVVPVDRFGQVAPVRGTLQVELFGIRHIAFQDAPSKRGRSYERLGSWTQLIAPEYIHSDGGSFKLPFQAAQPEFDTRIGLHGLLHARFAVPGAGVFETSLDSIRLRPFAPLRDSLERDTGLRFFPTEATTRGKRRQ
jgi:hypothetical protein